MNVDLKHHIKLTIKRRIVMHLKGRDKRQQNVGSSWRSRSMQDVCAWTARDKKRRIVESPWRFRSLKSFCHRYTIMFTFTLKLPITTLMTIWRFQAAPRIQRHVVWRSDDDPQLFVKKYLTISTNQRKDNISTMDTRKETTWKRKSPL